MAVPLLSLQHKMMVMMSEQALMDCSWGYGNYGCDGGETFGAYEWIMDNGCIPTEDTYGQYLQQVRWVGLVEHIIIISQFT